MRIPMYVAAAVGILAVAPELIRAIVASSASVLLECLPYLAAGAILARWLRRYGPAAAAFAGCGCGRAPGALSLPAAVATTAFFGPIVGTARLTTALIVWRFAERDEHDHATSLLDELARIVPSAVLCGIVVTTLPSIHVASAAPMLVFVAGAAIGALATPCTLGGIALAASLYHSAPFASYGMLCTIGLPISFLRWPAQLPPRFTALRSFIRACRFRLPQLPRLACTTVLLLAVVVGAPMPAAFANETTLTDLYPGEHLAFAGMYTHGTLVRYAITCCRADAAPVSIRLTNVRVRNGTWLRAEGVIVRERSELALWPQKVASIAPPSDPFLYR